MKKISMLLICLTIVSASFAGIHTEPDTAKKHHPKKRLSSHNLPGAALDPASRNNTGSTGSGNKTGKGQSNGNGGTPASPATPNHPPK